MEKSNIHLDDIKVRIEKLKNPSVNEYVDDTDVLIKKAKGYREKLNKQSSDIIEFLEKTNEVMENTKRLNNIKVRMKNLKVFLHGHVENIQKEVSVNTLKSPRDNLYANVKHVYDNIQKEFELIKKDYSTIKKDNNFIKSDISYIKKAISANKNNLEKHRISIVKNRKERYDNFKRIYDNIKKELESIKNDTKVYIKSHESNISNISSIKRDTYYNKKKLKYDNKNL